VNTKANFLRIPLFSGFSAAEYKKIKALAQSVSFAAGSVIFKEGQKGDTLYLIISGKVAIEKQPLVESTSPFLMLHLEEGDFFGEMAIFGKGIRNSTAKALCDTTMLVFPQGPLQQSLDASGTMAAKFFRNMLQSISLRSFQVNKALMAFYEVGRLLSGPFAVDTLLEQVLRIVMTSLDAAHGMILVNNPFMGGFQVKAAKGYLRERVQSLDIAGTGVGAKVLQKAQPLLVSNMRRSLELQSLERLGYEKNTMLLVPFGVGDPKTGLLVLAGKRTPGACFISDDLPLAAAIMQQIETVLENIQFQSEKDGRERLKRQYFAF
jgi:CRP-like cAMP-binding protein